MPKNKRDYLVIPSCPGLLDCFNTKKNRYSKESICHLVTDKEVNTIFIITLFSYIYHYSDRKDTDTYEIKISTLKHFRGQGHGSKAFDIKAELEKLNSIDCYWKDLDIDKLADVRIEGRKVIIQSKYFAELFKAMKYLTRRLDGKHGSGYSSLVSREILIERSRSAVEIVIEICKLVERRGAIAEGETAHLAIDTLIARCPTLSSKIDNTATISRKNQILREDLIKAEELLRDKTRIYKVFEDLMITKPEKLAVNKEGKIEIEHNGRNIKR